MGKDVFAGTTVREDIARDMKLLMGALPKRQVGANGEVINPGVKYPTDEKIMAVISRNVTSAAMATVRKNLMTELFDATKK